MTSRLQSAESFLDRHTTKIVPLLLTAGAVAVGLFINTTSPNDAEHQITKTMIDHENDFEIMKVADPSLEFFVFEDGVACTEALKKAGLRRQIVCSLPKNNE